MPDECPRLRDPSHAGTTAPAGEQATPSNYYYYYYYCYYCYYY